MKGNGLQDRPEFYDSVDKIDCPHGCGRSYNMAEMLNDYGGDFEGAFLLAHPGQFPCERCGGTITPEPNLEWRLWKGDDYEEYRKGWDKSR